MANIPSIDKIQRGIRVPRDVDARIRKRFLSSDTMTISDAYIEALKLATFGIDLSPFEYEQIEQEKQKAKAKRRR